MTRTRKAAPKKVPEFKAADIIAMARRMDRLMRKRYRVCPTCRTLVDRDQLKGKGVS